MKTAAVLLLVQAAAPSPGAAPRPALAFVPDGAEVGVAVELVLTLPPAAPDASGVDPGVWTVEPELDPSWVLLGSARTPPGEEPGRRTWRLASLEPGERGVPEELVAALAELGVEPAGPPARLDVASALAEGEDAPRPLHGFPEGFVPGAAPAAPPAWAWALGVVLLAGALAALVVVARRRRARRAARTSREPAPLERLAELEREGPRRADPGALAFELTHLVRTTTDRRLRRSADGLTDEEWLATLEGSGLAPDVRDELARFLAECARTKYAGARPTSWAVERELERTRRVLVAVSDGAGEGGGGAA